MHDHFFVTMKIYLSCLFLTGEVVELVNSGNPAIEAKLRVKGINIQRLGHRDYKDVKHLAKQV